MLRSGPRLPMLATLVLVAALTPRPAAALIDVHSGDDPVDDHNWPLGSLAVANLPTRIGWYEGPPFGGGQFEFDYRGDALAFQAALDAFAKIRATGVDLHVHDGGPVDSPIFTHGSDHQVDWSFTVWDPRSWNQLNNDPRSQFGADDPGGGFRQMVDPPRLDVYVGGRGIDLTKVRVPEGVRVTDERASAHGFTDGSAVAGDVFDLSTSKPVCGAKITVARGAPGEHWTDAATAIAGGDGRFQLRKLPVGTFGVIVTAEGYAPRLLGYIRLCGDTYERFTALLSPAATVAGTAIDTDGKPVAGAAIRADSVTGEDGRGYVPPSPAEVKTDAQGRFLLTGLPHGNLQMFAGATRYADLDGLKVYPIPAERLTIRLTATGDIVGRVIDVAGRPAPTGNVDIEPPGEVGDRIGHWGGGCNTAADGTFHFENVPPGDYIVSAMATNPGPALTGKDPNAKTITVRAGATVNVEVVGR